MDRPLFFALVIAGNLLFVSAQEDHNAAKSLDIKHENDVFVMTDKNFYHIVNTHEIVLVLFQVPWDAVYRSFLPEYEKAAKQLAEETPSVILARLDTSLYPDIAKEVDIRGDTAQFLYYHLSKPYNYLDDFGNSKKLVQNLQERSKVMYSPPRPHPELVDELSQHEFDRTLKGLDFAVVALYRSDCLSCVRLLLEYETALVNLTDIPKARFFKTNLDNAPDVASKYEIGVVPDLKIFRKGKIFDFKSDKRLVIGIIEHVKKQLIAPFKEYMTIDQAEGWARSYPNKAAVIGVFAKSDHPKFELFTDVANFYRDIYNFAWVRKVPADDIDEPHIPHHAFVDGAIAVYPPFRHVSPEEKKFQLFTESPTFEALSQFIEKKTMPRVGQRTIKNKDTTYAKFPLFIGYVKVDWNHGSEHDTPYHRNKIAQMVTVSKELTFAISDKREFKHELARMGLQNHEEELLIGIIGKNGEYYAGPVVDMMNLKILTDFAQDYLQNKLKPYYRTQSPPTSDDNDDYPVKTVVGATFRKLILRHDKPVALLAHRPYCPLCRTAVTLLNDLAHEKSLYPGLVYAMMDTNANDPPARFVPKTYPTLFVVPPNKKERPVVYPGRNFTKAAVMEFLDEHVANYRVKTEL